jgi:tetratricopeptide (TPR) repeat protein
MTIIKHIFCGFLLCGLSFSLPGQGREIKALLKTAESFFEVEDYFKARPVYLKILSLDKKNEVAGLNAAISGFRLNYPVDSLTALIPNLSGSSLPDAKYYLAKIYHRQKNFDEAIGLLETYLAVNAEKRMHNAVEINQLVSACFSAKHFMGTPHRSVIKNMGPEINSAVADYVPVILPDESALFFTSRREGSSNNVKDAYGNYHEDIYVCYKEGRNWKKAVNAGAPLNTETNDACVALSPDGQRMIIFRTAPDLVTGDLFITRIGKDNKWEEPQKMGKEINSQFIETSACFSNDTSEIYFTSNRPGGYGGKDVYRIKKLPNGKWAMPFNLGPAINTSADEDAPYLHPDGMTLYFSSKGHNTMGEYDVFRSVLNSETNAFSKAENLGYPINDVGSDIFFVLSVDGQRGYYSSMKDDSFGSTDIYIIDTRFGDNDLKVTSGTSYLGEVPGRVKITLLDHEDNQVSGVYNSNPSTGKFILVVNPLKSYKAIVEHEGYNTLVAELKSMAFANADNELEFKLIKK